MTDQAMEELERHPVSLFLGILWSLITGIILTVIFPPAGIVYLILVIGGLYMGAMEKWRKWKRGL